MHFITFILCVLFSRVGFSADVQFIELDKAHFEIEITLSPEEASPQSFKKGKKTFSRLPIENEGFQFGNEGKPELPILHRWLVVPGKSQYQVQVFPGQYKTYKNILMHPAQPDTFEEEVPGFYFPKGPYLNNKWYGKKRVQILKRSQLGPVTILPLAFWPAEYNPVRRELRVYEKLRVRLSFVGEDEFEEPIPVSPLVAHQISELTLNGQRLLTRGEIVLKSRKAGLLYNKRFQRYAQELANIFLQDGIEVVPIEVSSGLKPTAVKQLLQNQFSRDLPDAVLFFGDEVAIPLGSSGGKTGDFSYGLLSGTDQISDVAIGRLPVKNSNQAAVILNKIKKYRELQRLGFVNKRVMLLAHSQDYPGKYTRNMEQVRKSENPLSLEFNTQYGGEKGKNATVIEEAQKGYAIINYRGHGSSKSWSSWGSDGASFSFSQVKALPNEEKSMPFIFNVACTNGAIQNSSPSLVEMQLFPEESTSSVKGAIGTFGATAPSLTDVNHRFNLYLFESLQKASDKSIGNIYTLANNRLTKNNGGSATSNTRMYVLFADPFLAPWIE